MSAILWENKAATSVCVNLLAHQHRQIQCGKQSHDGGFVTVQDGVNTLICIQYAYKTYKAVFTCWAKNINYYLLLYYIEKINTLSKHDSDSI